MTEVEKRDLDEYLAWVRRERGAPQGCAGLLGRKQRWGYLGGLG